MTEPSSAPPDLRRRVRRDLLLDTLGNIALGLGLWGWLGHGSLAWLQQPYVFIPLTATGALNLLHLPARLHRLQAWHRRQ